MVSFSGVAIDFIQQLITDRTMSFRAAVRLAHRCQGERYRCHDSIRCRAYNVFRDLLEQGSSHTVGFNNGQVAGNGRTRWHFVSWSDGGIKDHTIVGSLAGGTLTASLGRDFQLNRKLDLGGLGHGRHRDQSRG